MKNKLMIALLMAGLVLVGCQKKEENHQGSTSSQPSTAIMVSNIADEKSQAVVKEALSKALPMENVDAFMKQVDLFNEEVKYEGLGKEFKKIEQPTYPAYENSYQDETDPAMTNCRLNTYLLLKDKLTMDKAAADKELLFLDREGIEKGSLLTKEEAEGFYQLFSRVKTENTKDVSVHAKYMKEHFSKIKFDDKATMLSVVMHDQLDGDYLFVGHVGVLVPSDTGFLFVEKLAFDEPYQAIQFQSKEEAYQYLLDKYAIDYNQPTAHAFIMENDELVKYRVD